MKRSPFGAVVLIALAGAGCATSGRPSAVPRIETAVPASAGPPSAVHWVRSSAEYRAAAVQAYRLATRRVEELAAGKPRGTWAVSLDADETILDNSQYQKERGPLLFSAESWREWVGRRAATAIPGSATFLRRVKELGGIVVVVTNRSHAECADTEANFRTLALPFDAMLCRPEGTPSEKEPRYDSITRGTVPGLPPLEIVLWVGDNIQDFPNFRQDVRKAGESGFAAFGERFVIIPNPMYGSWERNPPE